MTPFEALIAHQAAFPALPRPVPAVDSKEWQAWRKAVDEWQKKKDQLEVAASPVLQFIRQTPIVAHAADYDFRDYDAPVTRRSGPRPAWCGATKEYQAQKARESRARATNERRARKAEKQRARRAAEKAKAQEGAKAALESARERKAS